MLSGSKDHLRPLPLSLELRDSSLTNVSPRPHETCKSLFSPPTSNSCQQKQILKPNSNPHVVCNLENNSLRLQARRAIPVLLLIEVDQLGLAGTRLRCNGVLRLVDAQEGQEAVFEREEVEQEGVSVPSET